MHSVIHVGIAKSGTTTLQENIFARLRDVLFLGKPYQVPWIRDQIEALKWRDDGHLNLEPLKEFFAEKSHEARGSKKTLVLSEESLTSPPMKLLVARRLREVFDTPKILLTFRNQMHSVVSYYTKQGRILKKVPKPWAGRFVSFEEWFEFSINNIEGTHLDRLRYYDVANVYADVFGRQNVVLLLFEDMINRPAFFAEQMARLLNVSVNVVRGLLEQPAANTRSTIGDRKLHELNSSMPKGIRLLGGALPPPVKSKLKQAFSGVLRDSRRDKIELNADRKRQLINLYADGNQRLIKEWGLELGKYDYPL